MTVVETTIRAAQLFAGPGEMRERCRTLDWAATPLGAVETWPQALRLAVVLCLDSGFQMSVLGGPELVVIYNDHYRSALGEPKHPWALGRPAREVWAEIWEVIQPQLGQVLAGQSTAYENQRLILDRNGQLEETFWTYANSPVHDEAGAVVAVHIVGTETTMQVRAQNAAHEAAAALEKTLSEVKRAGAALRESEERYRALAELSPDGILVTTLDWRVTYANAALTQLLGAERMDQVVGLSVFDIVAPAYHEDVREHGTRLVRGDPVASLLEIRWRRLDGTPIDVEVSAAHVAWKGRTAMQVVARDITERRRTEGVLTFAGAELAARVDERTAELARANEALRAEIAERARVAAERNELLRQLALAQEEERRRLSRELHDEVGQHISALALGLQALTDIAAPGSEVDRRAEQLRALTATLGRVLHALAVRLRPKSLDDFGLEAALSSYAEEWSKQYGIAIDVHARLDAERLPAAVESAVYRIAQEALTNVAKHSGATRASVLLERPDGYVHAIIEDDGRGFDAEAVAKVPAAAARLGLLGMRERAALLGGKVEIESAPGAGTTLFVRIPLGQSGDVRESLPGGRENG